MSYGTGLHALHHLIRPRSPYSPSGRTPYSPPPRPRRGGCCILGARDSGVHRHVADTSVDTGELEGAALRLARGSRVATPFLPDLTDDVNALIAAADERVASLRGSLDAAIALKAEQEA